MSLKWPLRKTASGPCKHLTSLLRLFPENNVLFVNHHLIVKTALGAIYAARDKTVRNHISTLQMINTQNAERNSKMISQKIVLILLTLLAASPMITNNAYADSSPLSDNDLVIDTKAGLSIQSLDNSASFKLGGVLQWDYESDQTKDDGDTSNADVRRSRLYLKGHIKNWAYKATYKLGEKSNTNGDAVELYIRYSDLDRHFNITLGKQKEPFGLELLTSSKDISLLERSAITEYYTIAPGPGIQIHGKGHNWTYAAGVFASSQHDKNNFHNTAITGRITKALVNNNRLIVHLGAGLSSRNNYLNNKADVTHYNLEFALVRHAFHLQGEYFHSSRSPAASIKHGHYIQAGYSFNGLRPYKDGIFKGIRPQSESGAWELVTRYEQGLGKFSDVHLGKTDGKQISTGINYYLNNHIRMGMSYMVGKADIQAGSNEEFRARLQFLF